MLKHSSALAGKIPPHLLRAHLVMGALQLLAGSLVLALNVALAAASGQTALIGSGFWAGGFFLVAGVAGICVSRGGACGSRCCAAACLALSVLASGLAMGAIIGEGVVISANSDNHMRMHRLRKKCRQNQDLSTYLGLCITCLIIFLFEFVLAIVHTVYACRVCCYISQPSQPAQTGDQLPAAGNFLIIETDDGQTILVPAAAVTSAQLPAGGAAVLPLEQTGGSALSNDFLPVAEPQPPYNPHFMAAQPPPPYDEAENRF